VAIAATLDAVPSELKARRQWVAYRLEPGEPKPKKVPYRAEGQRASTTDPSHWLSFEDAFALVARGACHGVGFVFDAGDPYVGVDLDGAVDASGATADWAQVIVRELGSYAERSPSGTGVHVIAKGAIPAALKTKTVEVYDRGRYFTVTGRDAQGEVREAQAAIDAILRRYRTEQAPATDERLPPALLTELTDAEVVALIEASDDAAEFHRLYHAGEHKEGRQSEGDFGLALLLARRLGGDAERIKRLMEASALGREKWDKHKTYLERTIKAAIRRAGGKAAPSVPLLLTFSQLLTQPDLPWLIEGVLPAEGVGVLCGNRGAYKSMLALDWLATVASGAPDWFGHAVAKRGPAVYVYAEGRAGLGQRARAVQLARRLPDDLPLRVRPTAVSLMDARAVDGLIEDIGADAPALVVLDTLARNMPGGDENKQVDMNAVVASCDKIKERFGCFVLLVHHLNRSGTLRGSTVLDGAVETVFDLERTGKCAATLTCTKQKDNEERTWSLRLRPEAQSLVVAAAEAKEAEAPRVKDPLTKDGQAAFRTLVEHGGEMRMADWIAAAEEERAVGKTGTKNARAAAENAGLIEKVEGGRTAPVRLTEAGRSYAEAHGWTRITKGLVS
jgi:hypothetical protein